MRGGGGQLLTTKLTACFMMMRVPARPGTAGVSFIAADRPNPDRLTLGIMAMVAEEERPIISALTSATLQPVEGREAVRNGCRRVSNH